MKKYIFIILAVLAIYLVYKGAIIFINDGESTTIKIDKEKTGETLGGGLKKIKPAVNKAANKVADLTEEKTNN